METCLKCAELKAQLEHSETKVSWLLRDNERVSKEKDAEIERLKIDNDRNRNGKANLQFDLTTATDIIAKQKRVIEKLKGMVSHYETCATVDRYDDEKVPCDCGLEKELAAIEKGEA